ncbi:Hypothetical_protein [Hexamita inflata]|uniref:Hypothetical_protein n=1 Tax=Hexamita inflata TaxID=28002 RepID=A0AA86QW52_9EUKA|nr:Hypothetical protein HINF_LOCUS46285 [Hexamita inflata]
MNNIKALSRVMYLQYFIIKQCLITCCCRCHGQRLILQAGKDPSFPLLLNRRQFQSIICSKKSIGRAREVTLKFYLKNGVRLTNLKAFLSQEGKIMLEDSNLEDKTKIRTADSYLLQIEQHLDNHQNNRC